MERFSRTAMLIGTKTLTALQDKHVLIVGIGGVGTHAVESLARTGIGKMTLMDHDVIAVSNTNRQLLALSSTYGKPKVDVMAERIRDINPEITVNPLQHFYQPGEASQYIGKAYDYVVDAVDNVSAKLDIITYCVENQIPVISSMGAGNKLSPLTLTIADISQTSGCPLARVIRKELRKRGITQGVPVVFSPDSPLKPIQESGEPLPPGKTSLPGSISFVPAVAGYYLAYHVINHFILATT